MLNPESVILKTDGLVSGYATRRVLNGVSIDVGYEQLVAVVGHNGAGKSTLMKAIFGLLPVWDGHIVLFGDRIESPDPVQLVRKRVVYVPQGPRVFTNMSVYDNLRLAAISSSRRSHIGEGIATVVHLFPPLNLCMQRAADTLSGGEKQMLALACALMKEPRLLLLDEPSLGLAPTLTAQLFTRIVELNSTLGIAVLIVEQKVRDVLRIAQRAYVLRRGIVSYSGSAQDLLDHTTLRHVYL